MVLDLYEILNVFMCAVCKDDYVAPVCCVEVNHTLHIEKCDDGDVEPLTLTKMNKIILKLQVPW